MDLVLRFKDPYLCEIPTVIMISLVLFICRNVVLDKPFTVFKTGILANVFRQFMALCNYFYILLLLQPKVSQMNSSSQVRIPDKPRNTPEKLKKPVVDNAISNASSPYVKTYIKAQTKMLQNILLLENDECYYPPRREYSDCSISETENDSSEASRLEFQAFSREVKHKTILNTANAIKPYHNQSSKASSHSSIGNSSNNYAASSSSSSIYLKEPTKLMAMDPSFEEDSRGHYPQMSSYVSRRYERFASSTLITDYNDFASQMRDIRARVLNR